MDANPDVLIFYAYRVILATARPIVRTETLNSAEHSHLALAGLEHCHQLLPRPSNTVWRAGQRLEN